MIEFPATDVAEVAYRWDDQRIDLTSAGTLSREADASGFTSAVSAAATRFGNTWGDHLDGVAGVAEGQKVKLDDAVTTWLTTDASVGERRGFAQWRAQHD